MVMLRFGCHWKMLAASINLYALSYAPHSAPITKNQQKMISKGTFHLRFSEIRPLRGYPPLLRENQSEKKKVFFLSGKGGYAKTFLKGSLRNTEVLMMAMTAGLASNVCTCHYDDGNDG